MTLSSNNIHEKLIPSASYDMQKSYRGNAERLSMSYGTLFIRKTNNPIGGYQLSDGKEQLMIPLGIEIVVPVININPPRVIIWEQSRWEEEHHGLSKSLFDRQSRQVLHCLIKHNYSDDSEHPYFQHVRSGIEVHVFVWSDTGFVWACKKVSIYRIRLLISHLKIFVEFSQILLPLKTVSQQEQEQYRLSTTLE